MEKNWMEDSTYVELLKTFRNTRTVAHEAHENLLNAVVDGEIYRVRSLAYNYGQALLAKEAAMSALNIYRNT